MKRMVAWMLVAVVAVAAAGCGGVAEKASQKAAEKIIEKSIENESGGNVDVNLSDEGGTVKIESEEGSVSIGGGEIPASIDVPFPDGGNVTLSVEAADGATVMVEYPGADFDEIAAFYQKWTDDSSEEFEKVTYSAGDLKSESWTSGATTIAVQTCSTSDGKDGVCVSVNVSK